MKNPRLAAAAEALIEAASLEVDAFTNKKLAENLESLKTSFDSNLNKAVQKLDSSQENLDAKINTMNQHLSDVKDEIGALRKLMEDERKQKTLDRARALTSLGSFTYYTDSKDCYRRTEKEDSTALAHDIIGWFSMNYGHNLPDGRMEASRPYEKTELDASKKAFRDNISKQIKDLIQREPRLVFTERRWLLVYLLFLKASLLETTRNLQDRRWEMEKGERRQEKRRGREKGREEKDIGHYL